MARRHLPPDASGYLAQHSERLDRLERRRPPASVPVQRSGRGATWADSTDDPGEASFLSLGTILVPDYIGGAWWVSVTAEFAVGVPPGLLVVGAVDTNHEGSGEPVNEAKTDPVRRQNAAGVLLGHAFVFAEWHPDETPDPWPLMTLSARGIRQI